MKGIYPEPKLSRKGALIAHTSLLAHGYTTMPQHMHAAHTAHMHDLIAKVEREERRGKISK